MKQNFTERRDSQQSFHEDRTLELLFIYLLLFFPCLISSKEESRHKYTGIKLVSGVKFFQVLQVFKKKKYIHILDVIAEVTPYDFY